MGRGFSPFSFSSYFDEENLIQKNQIEKPKIDKVEEAKKWRNHKPAIQPPSTEGFERYVEF